MKHVLLVSSVLSFIAGISMVLAGFGVGMYTYQSVLAEKITTPKDASIPSAAVAGPLTMNAQAEAILQHTLTSTGGKRFSEMPRTIAKLDAEGKPVLNEKGEAVMVPNEARNIWFQAVALRAAIHLGMMSYGIAALIMGLGFLFLMNGFAFHAIRKQQQG